MSLERRNEEMSWRENGAEVRRNSCHQVRSDPVIGVRVGLPVLYAKEGTNTQGVCTVTWKTSFLFLHLFTQL